ncbi:MAG: chromosome partitioning protein ParB [Betaproteobacteria bacterium SG8_39]|nr:MAG: chromosome partitioning protein ParB [Betaproteobacteria bacterium SG8_39]
MAAAAKRKSGLKRAPAKKRAKKAVAHSRGLTPADARLESLPAEAAEARERVEAVGGEVVGSYRDPLGKQPLLIAVLPLDAVERTPFQRDVSDMHHKRLADVIDKTGIFLDPIIAITAPDTGFWTPNGGHRLAALKRLGARSVTALVVPKRDVAWQILALNTEKAHNLKERSLEVIRIVRGLLEEGEARPEASFAFYLEEASLVTLGLCYEENPRFSGGAYNPVVRRLSSFSDEPLSRALRLREKHAAMLKDLDVRVAEVVTKLKARGLASPYLKTFVVARINPLRWVQGDPPPLEEVLKTMRERAAKFNVEKIKQQDIVATGGVPDDAD